MCVHMWSVHARWLLLCMHAAKCTCMECTCIRKAHSGEMCFACYEVNWLRGVIFAGRRRAGDRGRGGGQESVRGRGDTFAGLGADVGDARVSRVAGRASRSAHGRAEPLGGVLRAAFPGRRPSGGHSLRRRPSLLPAQAAAGSLPLPPFRGYPAFRG